MDRPPAHHPDCECKVDDIDKRVISASNIIIDFASDVAVGHMMCSSNALVAAYILVEYIKERCEIEENIDINHDTKAHDAAKRFYEYSNFSRKRKIN